MQSNSCVYVIHINACGKASTHPACMHAQKKTISVLFLPTTTISMWEILDLVQDPSLVHYDSLRAFPSTETVKSRLLYNALIHCLKKTTQSRDL